MLSKHKQLILSIHRSAGQSAGSDMYVPCLIVNSQELLLPFYSEHEHFTICIYRGSSSSIESQSEQSIVPSSLELKLHLLPKTSANVNWCDTLPIACLSRLHFRGLDPYSTSMDQLYRSSRLHGKVSHLLTLVDISLRKCAFSPLLQMSMAGSGKTLVSYQTELLLLEAGPSIHLLISQSVSQCGGIVNQCFVLTWL